jgi:hypothetical protein
VTTYLRTAETEVSRVMIISGRKELKRGSRQLHKNMELYNLSFSQNISTVNQTKVREGRDIKPL